MQPKFFLKLAFIVLLSTLISGCGPKSKQENNNVINITIETDFGDIKAFLYNQTPRHRDNFVQNTDQGVYDGVIFHRVIENFMIQSGDQATGINFMGDIDMLKKIEKVVDAEFNNELIHKKGAIAAARMADNVNPLKQSSSSQFYIVQGRVFTPDELNQLALQKTENAKNIAVNKLIMDKAEKMIDEGKNPNLSELHIQLKDTIEIIKLNLKPYIFTEEQINTYTTIGGTPHLDGDYTVFGEVVEGFEVIDKIAAVKTNAMDKPISDVKMKVKIIK
ncbi:MAG TPA: peptidylprolyl isomerase [Bacteroidales bacterium]|jgi:cyclophilin family peptidyl-prolyl cis-trans isomerase|nr:peptidylprolyl isomerase [Bacteroidales bacterium]